MVFWCILLIHNIIIVMRIDFCVQSINVNHFRKQANLYIKMEKAIIVVVLHVVLLTDRHLNIYYILCVPAYVLTTCMSLLKVLWRCCDYPSDDCFVTTQCFHCDSMLFSCFACLSISPHWWRFGLIFCCTVKILPTSHNRLFRVRFL